MKLFTYLYDHVMTWAEHPKAQRYLAAVSFAESSFFPIPVVLMLLPMMLAQPNRKWLLALYTTFFSVLGGIAGYFIGAYFFEIIGEPLINLYHAQEKFLWLQSKFSEYGVWFVLIAGVSPVPYKLMTIASGALGLAFVPFVLGSIVGRSAQFLIAALVVSIALRVGGENIMATVRKYVDWIGWSLLLLAVIVYFVIR